MSQKVFRIKNEREYVMEKQRLLWKLQLGEITFDEYKDKLYELERSHA